MTYTDRKTLKAAHEIADKLAAMDNTSKHLHVFGPKILKLMKGVKREVFTALDEKPGYFNYMNDRFWMLRTVRNNPDWGRAMFEGFK